MSIRRRRRGRHAAPLTPLWVRRAVETARLSLTTLAAPTKAMMAKLGPALPSPGQFRRSLTVFGAAAASLTFVAVNAVDPTSANALPMFGQTGVRITLNEGQNLQTSGAYVLTAAEEQYVASARASVASMAPFAVPAGSAQAIARPMVAARGWDENEFRCLVLMWNHESNWRTNAVNVSSGAYGIPQALPGDKMASIAPDWRTNPETQIAWGLGYIQKRYHTPCEAWALWQQRNWY